MTAFSQATAQKPPATDVQASASAAIQILFNDRHAHANPSTLKRARVSAALARGASKLVPLRSMFEQMGATVTYDARTRTIELSKPAFDFRVTVDKSEVVFNGAAFPLDVSPQYDDGAIVVPLRVFSESSPFASRTRAPEPHCRDGRSPAIGSLRNPFLAIAARVGLARNARLGFRNTAYRRGSGGGPRS